MGKVKEVITENEGLHERRKSDVLASLLDSFDDEDDDDGSSEDKVLPLADHVFFPVFPTSSQYFTIFFL